MGFELFALGGECGDLSQGQEEPCDGRLVTFPAKDKFVTLAGGMTVPLEPYLLLLELERRGVVVSLAGERILAGPKAKLTDGVCNALHHWKPHLRMLLAYQPPTRG